MAKSKLFPAATPDKNDKRDPHERFAALAAHVVTTPKAVVDAREKHWRKSKTKGR
jgi:hypothetical protein